MAKGAGKRLAKALTTKTGAATRFAKRRSPGGSGVETVPAGTAGCSEGPEDAAQSPFILGSVGKDHNAPATERSRAIVKPAEDFNNGEGDSFDELIAGCRDFEGRNYHIVLVCELVRNVSHWELRRDVLGCMKVNGANSVHCGARIAVYMHLTHFQTKVKVGEVRGSCRVVRYMKPVGRNIRKPEHSQFLLAWKGLAGHHLDEILAEPKETEAEGVPQLPRKLGSVRQGRFRLGWSARFQLVRLGSRNGPFRLRWADAEADRSLVAACIQQVPRKRRVAVARESLRDLRGGETGQTELIPDLSPVKGRRPLSLGGRGGTSSFSGICCA